MPHPVYSVSISIMHCVSERAISDAGSLSCNGLPEDIRAISDSFCSCEIRKSEIELTFLKYRHKIKQPAERRESGKLREQRILHCEP